MNNADFHPVIARCYGVKCFRARTGTGSDMVHGRHVELGIIAPSAVHAMDYVLKRWPEYRIDAVNERAMVHAIEQAPI